MRALAIALVALAACSSGGGDDATVTTTVPSSVPERAQHAFRGRAQLDGADVDTRFLGAVVRDHGLITACQAELPSIANGRYEIGVLSAPGATGCGKRGTEVLLWMYVGEQKLFSTMAVPWPDGDATADVEFSSTRPLGAATSVTELNGVVLKQSLRMPVGTIVEAFVDDTRCGVASVRDSDGFVGYILNVVDESARPGCLRGATLRFEVDGERAVETSVNSPEHSGDLNLTVA
jgi:hypothetical protein